MKALKSLLAVLITLVSFLSVAYGVLFLLQEERGRNYVNIYGEDESAY